MGKLCPMPKNICQACGGTGEAVDSHTVSRQLRRKRESAGVSQDAMATELGISPSHLSLIEHGKRNLNALLVIQYQEALDKLAA